MQSSAHSLSAHDLNFVHLAARVRCMHLELGFPLQYHPHQHPAAFSLLVLLIDTLFVELPSAAMCRA